MLIIAAKSFSNTAIYTTTPTQQQIPHIKYCHWLLEKLCLSYKLYYFATEAQQYNSTLAEMAEYHIGLCMAVRQGEVHKLGGSGRLPLLTGFRGSFTA